MNTRTLWTISSRFAISSTLLACGSAGESTSAPLTTVPDAGAVTDGATASETGAASSHAGANACATSGEELCDRACACSSDGKCRLVVVTDAGSGSVVYDSPRHCRDFYVVLACQAGGDPAVDYDACASRARAAACVPSEASQGLALPVECTPRR